MSRREGKGVRALFGPLKVILTGTGHTSTLLKKYVDENEIAWPQYYQGNGWDSEFSTSWGINGIPTLFAVDQKGNLHTVQARGKVEELIHELLAD